MKRKPPPNHKLLEERFAQQMSRAALASESGVSAKTLWEYETRGTYVRMSNASRVAAALKKPISALFDEAWVIG